MNVVIVGIGLVGGSLAKSMRSNGFAGSLLGVDHNSDHLRRAQDIGLIDEGVSLEDGVANSDLIILATPVNKIVALVPDVLDLVEQQVVMDVGSTKSLIMNAAKDHKKRGRFVGTHPMAGTEYSGPDAAVEGLFNHKCAVIVDHEASDQDALDLVTRLYESLEMSIVYHESEDHDIHTAYVSHISHISSFAVALTV